MTSPAMERYRSLPEEDRQIVLLEILDTRSWTLETDALGILRLALDQGTDTLTEKQTWRLLYGAWVPNIAVECSRDGGPLQPWEMVQATAQGGRCSSCENTWQKILAE